MRSKKRIVLTAFVCVGLFLLAYFAWKLPFYEFETNSFDTSLDKLFSLEYLKTLVPLFIIVCLAAAGIVLCVWLRKLLAKTDKDYRRFAEAHTGRSTGRAPIQKRSLFMTVRWLIMIVFAFLMIFGGLVFGLRMASISIPILSCPWNTEQMAEASCYYLAHLNELFELPIKDILIFAGSTLGFTILLGRAVCGFLCPMGLIQDLMDKLRQNMRIEGGAMNERLYSALTPIKWCMVLIFLSLCFVGGNFCNFCPAVAVSPILAGMMDKGLILRDDPAMLAFAYTTPISALILAECLEAGGLPKGVFSALPGPGSVVGNALVEDERIAKITFTGSTAVGREIARKAAEHLKKVTLEMGGKSPAIILKDFDVDKAVEIALFGAYFHQGQICMANSRLIVEAPIYDEFCEKMAARVAALKMGGRDDPMTVIGPLIRADHCQIIDEQIADAVAKGARLLVSGEHEGAFYHPALLADVTPEMEIFHEESFGPVTSIIRAADEEEALALCNNSKYGLSSALLTNDVRKVFALAPRIEAGMVHVNDTTVMGARSAPFGGVKMSGQGREGGHFSIEEFSEIKWVTIRYEGGGFPPM